MRRNLIAILFLFATSLFSAVAQSVVVKAEMDSTAMWVGQQTAIHLTMSQEADSNVIYPELITNTEIIPGIEIIDVSLPDTTKLKNNRIEVRQDVVITSFDSGFYYIPPFKYVLGDDTIATESLALKIVPVEINPETISSDVADIKDVEKPPFVLWDYLPDWLWIVLLVVILLALAVFLFVKFHKKKQSSEVVVPEKKIPPYELAMQLLQELRSSQLWQKGEEKQYYTRLVDILREYIDNRFGINAMEMTSAQIIEALQRNKELRDVNKYINDILSMADFVKFAKMRPLPDDNERVMTHAIEFVELTRPQPQPEADSQDDNNDNKQQ